MSTAEALAEAEAQFDAAKVETNEAYAALQDKRAAQAAAREVLAEAKAAWLANREG